MIGGEFFAEILQLEGYDKHWEFAGTMLDVTMAVLARHINQTIADDDEIPVIPQPTRKPEL